MTDNAASTTPPQRRQLTVLFLDVVGSTALTRRLDPEDVLEIMDGALKRFATVVAQHGGRVLQYAGDSVLAAFGADAAREDDAERAVHAGLALLAAAREHAAEVQRQYGQSGFDVRVGVHTGHVLLGGGVDEDGTIRGFTVNIAARLEQSAPPGHLRISHDTWRHVRGVFEVQVQAPLQVKGQDEPLVTYLVQSARPRTFRAPSRGIEGLETAIVGRSAELAQLMAAFERTVAGGGLQCVSLLAEAGLGKSRLVTELQHRMDVHAQTCWLLRGRSQPGSQQQPYGLLRDVLAWRLQIVEGGSADRARERLVQGLVPFLANDGEEQALRQAELLGQLIGMDFSSSPRLVGMIREPRLLRDAALDAFATYLQRLAASDGSPVVLLLDDLQWADDASLDWLQQLGSRTELPLLLLMAARPGLLERRISWGQGWPRHETLTLAPLGMAESKQLTRSLLGRLAEVPPELEGLVEGQAEGNPYYAEELVQMLIDDGAIDTSNEPWQLRPGRLDAARIPGTLIGVLQARLDALAASERRAVQMASIVGPVFWDDALHSLDAEANAALPALQRKAMVRPRAESTFADTREEAFHHHLLHQVTYDTLLKADRRAGHARAAQWLAERVGDREAEYLAVTAEHYARAGDPTRALEWFERAATAASDRFANAATLHYLARMLAMPELGDTMVRWRIAKFQVSVADLIGDRALQQQANQECLRLAELLGDDTALANTLTGMALLADRLGNLVQARELAERCVEVAGRCDSAVAAALAHGELSWLAHLRGDMAEAHRQLEIALPAATRAAQQAVGRGDHVLEISLRVVAASLHSHEYDRGRARALTQEALELAEQRNVRRMQCACHAQLSDIALDMADPEAALHHTAIQATIAADIGLAEYAAKAMLSRAQIALLRGEPNAAVQHVQAALASYGRLGALYHLGECHVVHARALAACGDAAAGQQVLRALQEACELYTRIGNDDDARASRLLLADAVRESGDGPAALAAVEAELTAIDAPGALDAALQMVPARGAVWHVLAAAGDARALRHLELAATDLRRMTEKISDPAELKRVLTTLPLHREIIAAWAAHSQAPVRATQPPP